MIDLTKKGLPNTVVVSGKPYSIHTDFRLWLAFGRSPATTWHTLYVENIPPGGGLNELMEFYVNSNPLPRPIEGKSGARPYDLDIDSEAIVAAFMERYGIDITSAELHWHMFKTLFNNIVGMNIGDIIQARLYVGKDSDCKKQRAAWALPEPQTAHEQINISAAERYLRG